MTSNDHCFLAWCYDCHRACLVVDVHMRAHLVDTILDAEIHYSVDVMILLWCLLWTCKILCIAGLDYGEHLWFVDFGLRIASFQISLNLWNLDLSTRTMTRQLLTQRFGVEHFQWLDGLIAAFDALLPVELRSSLVAIGLSRRSAVVGSMFPLEWP